MFRRKLSSPHAGNRRRPVRKHSLQLHPEPLERRECLAVTVLELGESLLIAGDAESDRVEIVDHGDGALTVNGAEYSGIHTLTINTRGGADEVYLNALGELSLSQIRIELGLGDDIADLNLGTVAGILRSEITGGAGRDQIRSAFDAVLAEGDAVSIMEGGVGDDLIRCVQNNIAGRASCVSRGGVGNDDIECVARDVSGYSGCISDGGVGDDEVTCTIDNLTASGSALCQLTGGTGNDALACDKGNIQGQHVCFANGGTGKDTMNWIVRGDNSGDFQCTMLGGTGDDTMNILVGADIEGVPTAPVGFTGTVEYFADAGKGDDEWIAHTNFSPDSDGVFSNFTVLLARGNDTAILNFIALGSTQVQTGLVSGGRGQDTYFGPPPMFLPFPVEDFEIGISQPVEQLHSTPVEVISEIGTARLIAATVLVPAELLEPGVAAGVTLTISLDELRVNSEVVPLGTQTYALAELEVLDPDAGAGVAIVLVTFDPPTAELNANSLVQVCTTLNLGAAIGPTACEILEPIR